METWDTRDMSTEEVFNGEVARAARALVGVSAQYVADEAKVPKKQLRQFEKGIGTLTADEQDSVQQTLVGLGAELIPEEDEHGYGVRLKWARSTTHSLPRWEAEGGPVAEDDV